MYPYPHLRLLSMTPNISPWNIGNGDPNLSSPDGKWLFEYENIGEIAMGAPLGGMLFLRDRLRGHRLDLNLWAGGL